MTSLDFSRLLGFRLLTEAETDGHPSAIASKVGAKAEARVGFKPKV
ncbi:MAG: hypothetical protein AAFW69_05120 [Pseudomonadota bacterium]